MELFTSSFYFCAERGFSSRRVTCVRAASRCLFLPCLLPRRELKVQFRALEFSTLLEKTRRGLATTSPWRVRGAPKLAWVSPACEAGRGAVGSHDPQPLSSLSPSHIHISPVLPSLGLCLDVRGYLLLSGVSRRNVAVGPPPQVQPLDVFCWSRKL